MLMQRPIAASAVFALLFSAVSSTNALAETVIKFNLAGVSTEPDVSFGMGVLNTLDDGAAGTVGDQSTDVSYQGFLGFLPTIPSGASLTLSGVSADGSASGSTGLITQATAGGMFSLFDNMNDLLLSGSLGSGVIAGAAGNNTGSFFSTTPILYTGGSLLPLIQPNSGAITLSLNDVRTGGNTGMVVQNGTLLDFTATANGQLAATAVPEPSVIGMAAIGAIAMVCHHRRRRAAKTA